MSVFETIKGYIWVVFWRCSRVVVKGFRDDLQYLYQFIKSMHKAKLRVYRHLLVLARLDAFTIRRSRILA